MDKQTATKYDDKKNISPELAKQIEAKKQAILNDKTVKK